MGFFTPLTSFSLALISFVKIASRGFFPSEGIPFNKDMLFLVCFLTTLFAGAGIISFDALLDRRKKKNVIEPVDKSSVTGSKVIAAEVIVEPSAEIKEEEKVNP